MKVKSNSQEHIWTGITGDREVLAERTKDLPTSPGVYVFYDQAGEVLYVGKGANLRSRVRSYFGPNLSTKTEALMEKVGGLETIIVDSEAEALILECNLIKKHRPRYNILLRDDKNYPYLRIDLEEEWPRVNVVRRMNQDGARYFGPFTKSGSLRETLSLLRRIFPYRTCSDAYLSQASRPCLDYQIGRCLGPCTGDLDRDTYMETIDGVIKFLEGRHKDVRDTLSARMQQCAENLDFEGAARIRDRISALDDVTQKQKIVLSDMKDRDLLGLARSGKLSFVALLPVREGKIMGKEGFVLTGTELDEDCEIISAFVSQYYPNASFIPKEVVVPVSLPDAREISEYTGLKIRVPKRGVLKDLVSMANDNARAMMQAYVPRYERETQETVKALRDLADALELPEAPRRIECYDISNTSGKEAVASMVLLLDGKPDKSSYRRFRMKTDGKPDDYGMIQEVLWRRFRRGIQERDAIEKEGKMSRRQSKFAIFPDLIIVDGGKGQVSAGKQVLDELELDIPIAGLAERNEEIFLPHRSEPVILPRDSGALFLLIRIRDEAHRFALSYHRDLRDRKSIGTELSQIPGLGPQKSKELLKVFGSVDAVKSASYEDLLKVKGIGPKLASSILEYFDTHR